MGPALEGGRDEEPLWPRHKDPIRDERELEGPILPVVGGDGGLAYIGVSRRGAMQAGLQDQDNGITVEEVSLYPSDQRRNETEHSS